MDEKVDEQGERGKEQVLQKGNTGSNLDLPSLNCLRETQVEMFTTLLQLWFLNLEKRSVSIFRFGCHQRIGNSQIRGMDAVSRQKI